MRPISKAEFARERGFSRARLYQLIDDGRVAPLVDGPDAGKIDADEAHKRLDANLDQAKGSRRDGNVTTSAPAAGTGAPAGAADLLTGGGDVASSSADRDEDPSSRDDYWEHRARRERAEAEISEMKALQQAGSLVPAAAVRKEAAEIARSMRNSILEIPDRISAVLDPANPARAHKLLTDELGKVLRDFGQRLEERSAADTGPAESEGAVLQSIR